MATELMDLLYEFVKVRMSEQEQRNILTSAHILNRLDEESEDEIKNELYKLMLYSVSWNQLINRIHADLAEEEDEDEDEDETDEEKERLEDEDYDY